MINGFSLLLSTGSIDQPDCKPDSACPFLTVFRVIDEQWATSVFDRAMRPRRPKRRWVVSFAPTARLIFWCSSQVLG